jgi:hypothetical protein
MKRKNSTPVMATKFEFDDIVTAVSKAPTAPPLFKVVLVFAL